VNLTAGGNFTSNIGPFAGETRSVDGENVVLGANYGLSIGEKGFLNLTGELNFRGSTNRMLEFTGGIFNGLNGIERVASAAIPGIDVTTLSLNQIQQIAPQVGYFDQSTIASLNGLESLDGLNDVLGFDATDAELAARGLQRSDFNMRVGQSENRAGKLFANFKTVAVTLGVYFFLIAIGRADPAC
jgi:iron complex outermembrane receptor protein